MERDTLRARHLPIKAETQAQGFNSRSIQGRHVMLQLQKSEEEMRQIGSLYHLQVSTPDHS